MKRRSAATSCFRLPWRSRLSALASASESLGSKHDARSDLYGACLLCWVPGSIRPHPSGALIWYRVDPRDDPFSHRVAAASAGAGGLVPAVAASHRSLVV